MISDEAKKKIGEYGTCIVCGYPIYSIMSPWITSSVWNGICVCAGVGFGHYIARLIGKKHHEKFGNANELRKS